MLVIFYPQNTRQSNHLVKVQPLISNWAQNNPNILKNSSWESFFWCSKLGVEQISKSYGWLLGYAHFDNLPSNYNIESKELLDICLELWRIEGVDFLKRLNGSFNLFLHDTFTGKSIISTDRFSTYALWQAELEGGAMAYSPCFSYLIPLVKRDIDLAAIWSFAVRIRPVGNHTLLNQIKGVRQATAVIFDNNIKPNYIQWYKPKYKPELDRSISYWGGELNRCLEQVTSKCSQEIARPGLLLSGGIDSRLLASFCPKNTKCFTLADFYNKEMKTGSKISNILGLQHYPIIRDSDWYPRTVIPSAKRCAGLWRWNNHFMQLENLTGDWQTIDGVFAGYWFDTFLKSGAAPAELWVNQPDFRDFDKVIAFLLYIDDLRYQYMNKLNQVIKRDIFEQCHKQCQRALEIEWEKTYPLASCIVDVWELCMFGVIYRSSAYTDIDSLRTIVASRAVTLDNVMYDLYLRIPANKRKNSSIVRNALWQRKKKLALLLDSNSWLPVVFPENYHDKALQARRTISKIRKKWYQITGSTEYKSHGSWPQIGRLWATNTKMMKIIDDIIAAPTPLLEELFNMDSVARVWRQHKEGIGDYCDILDIVVGLAFCGIK